MNSVASRARVWWSSSHPATSARTGRDWTVDVLALLLAVGIGLLGTHTLLHGWDGYPPALRIADAVLGGATCLAIFWRKRSPVAYVYVTAALSTFCTLASISVLVAVFTVAVHRSWRVALPATVAAAAAAVPEVVIYERPDRFWSTLTASVILTFAVTGWGMFTRARRALLESLRDRLERAESEQHARAERARLDERARIAREMHDALAHRLSLLSVHAGALEFRPDAPPAEIAQASGVIRATAHDALEELRAVISLLRARTPGDVPERPQPTIADLAELAAESRAAGTPVTVRIGADVDGVPASVGRAVYRIAQEGLTNARKHAGGAGVTLALSGRRGQGLTVTVRSRRPVGRAVSAVPGSGTGLVGLRERATLAGGQLEYGETEDGDFRLSAWLPWPA